MFSLRPYTGDELLNYKNMHSGGASSDGNISC